MKIAKFSLLTVTLLVEKQTSSSSAVISVQALASHADKQVMLHSVATAQHVFCSQYTLIN